MAVIITKENFENEVMKSNIPVLIDFWAPWCGPCRMMGPVIDTIEAENPHIKVGKVNVDEQPELAQKFNVMSIPMLAAFKDGQLYNTSVGVQPKDSVLSLFE